ncbi:MAG: phosphate-starvation-inducible PsiE family protein [Bacteroidetes bacterium]|nr:phosphate-starvation-inducible PsiE family protein [Bacteroidota bacterium]
MFNYIRQFEKFIIKTLTVMMVLVVLLSTAELGWVIIQEMITIPYVFLEIDQLLEIFGLFLLVLIGIELLETIKTYLSENVIRVEVVFLVAIIAISRKVIIMEIGTQESLKLVGIASIILALSVGYYLFKKSLK